MAWKISADFGWGGIVTMDDETVSQTTDDNYNSGRPYPLDFNM